MAGVNSGTSSSMSKPLLQRWRHSKAYASLVLLDSWRLHGGMWCWFLNQSKLLCGEVCEGLSFWKMWLSCHVINLPHCHFTVKHWKLTCGWTLNASSLQWCLTVQIQHDWCEHATAWNPYTTGPFIICSELLTLVCRVRSLSSKWFLVGVNVVCGLLWGSLEPLHVSQSGPALEELHALLWWAVGFGQMANRLYLFPFLIAVVLWGYPA